jgi:hypothetical protein
MSSVARRIPVRTNVAHVRAAFDSGPVGGEDASAPLIGLALPSDGVAGSLESEVEAADAREEASDIHPYTLLSPGRCKRQWSDRVIATIWPTFKQSLFSQRWWTM